MDGAPPKPWQTRPPDAGASNILRSNPGAPPSNLNNSPQRSPRPLGEQTAAAIEAAAGAAQQESQLALADGNQVDQNNNQENYGYGGNNSYQYGGGSYNSYGGNSMYGGGYGGGMGYGGYGGMGMMGMRGGMNRNGPDNSGDWYVPLSKDKTTLQKFNDFNDSAVDFVITRSQNGGRKIIGIVQWLQVNLWTGRSRMEKSRITIFAVFAYLCFCFVRLRRARQRKLLNIKWNELFPSLPGARH
eukprot:gene576-100_t